MIQILRFLMIKKNVKYAAKKKTRYTLIIATKQVFTEALCASNAMLPLASWVII